MSDNTVNTTTSTSAYSTSTIASTSTSSTATFVGTLEDWFKWTSSESRIFIEKCKDHSNLPWWTTISCLTLGLRVAVFPLRLRAWRNGRLMKMSIEHCNRNYAPLLRAKHAGNIVDVKGRDEGYKRDMIAANTRVMKEIGASPWKSLSPLPVSIPLFLSVAAGLRAIDYKGEGLTSFIWKDFGEAAVQSAVPVFISNFIYIEISRRNQLNVKDKLRKKMPFILGHSLNILSFVLLTQVPSAVNFFLLNSSILSIIEGRILSTSTSTSKSTGLLEKWVEMDFNNKASKLKSVVIDDK